MMLNIKSIHRDYFQKSGVFLYPALGIKRGVSITPIETYLAWEEYGIDPKDKRLVCLYHYRDDQEFRDFEKLKLTGNKHFEALVFTEDGSKAAYIFDYRPYAQDWDHFLRGKYSKLSMEFKRKVKDFFRPSGNNYVYIESFLHPEKYFALYAELLSVPIETLKEVGELCSPPEHTKELLSIKIKSSHLKSELTNGNK